MHCACMYNYSFPFWKLYLDAPRMSIGSVCFLLLAASLVVVHLCPQAGVPFDICHQTCTFPTLQADTVLPFYPNKEKLWRGIGIITLHSKQPPKESGHQSSISSELFEISKINLRARQERFWKDFHAGQSMPFPVRLRLPWILGSTCKGLSDIGIENKHAQVNSRNGAEHRTTTQQNTGD